MAKQAHYESLSPQPIEVIRAWKLDFNLGNVVKYIGRCRTKGQELEDLEKAKVYLQWRIDELKEEKARYEAELKKQEQRYSHYYDAFGYVWSRYGV